MSTLFSFPKGFFWGAATSSYQIEGGNKNNDWFLWEVEGKVPFSCGRAVDSYHRFGEDFNLAKFLGHNVHRLSFEWSRIQPQEDKFDNKEIEHYKEVISSLLEKRIKPIVTLHHFTNPLWFYKNECWLNPQSSDYFARYVDKISKDFSELVNYWITINEPLVYIYNSYIKGIWPPGEKSFKKALKVLENIKRAHLKAYSIIHKNCKKAEVSIAKNMRVFSPCFWFNLGQNSIPAFLRSRFFNFKILDFFLKKQALDFLGLNYYSKDFVRFSLKDFFGNDCYSLHHNLRKNSLNWYVWPSGLFEILIQLKKFKLPIIITENGTTEKEDFLYQNYLKKHLFFVAKALKEGVNVLGYIWWSLIDNFEWDKGFQAKFGLIEVDKELNRKLKPFSFVYKDICTKNRIEYD